jgi:transposase-like protein
MPFPSKHDPKLKARAIAMLKAGIKTQTAIADELGIPSQTVSTWYHRHVKAASKPKQKRKSPKASSATSYLAKQLEVVSKMLRAKLPELAKFSLVTDANGKTTVEYTVRQLTEVSGSVKL